jgi:murein DD-endopeptidase MepM/ murein hydrolase activator NlpD
MLFPIEDLGGYRTFGIKYPDGIHTGHDFNNIFGNEIKAIDDGVVNLVGMFDGFGSLNPRTRGGAIWIMHNGFYALYGHMNFLVHQGQIVHKGDIIGTVNNFSNNNINYPHLHLSIWNSEEKYPMNHWGYVEHLEDLSFYIDPILFINNRLEK